MSADQSAAGGLRVIVDASLCRTYGLCVAADPELFDIPAGSPVARVLHDAVDDGHRDIIEEAIDACPARAISLERQRS